MATCPTCFKTYPAGVSTCEVDETTLVPDETFAHVDKDVPPGTTVGEYRIESKLGEGGFGAVYRAVHPLIGKMAAVKVLSRQFSSNPQMVSRFIAEARAVNQIRHRHIIDIFSFGQLPDGRQYYIMELLEGESFDTYLAKRKRLSLAEALPILRGVARALDAAHAKNILHRDLKPENVFLVFDDEGRIEPKLLDFGLVKLMADTSGHKTKTGTPMGTPYYMSPEQCRGLEADARTDVYSFGALVFEVLTGAVPYDGTSTMDILVQHMTALPPSASQRCSDVPSALDAPLARILAKEPKDRPDRVGEALELLARAINLESGTATVSSPYIAGSGMDAGHATANTLMADAPVQVTTRAGARSPAAVQTFLGAETDVPPPRTRSRARVVAGVLGLAVIVGTASFAVSVSRKKESLTAVTRASNAAAAVESTSASALATPPSAALLQAPRNEVDVKVDGAPEGAVVAANGVELGAVPGPFKLKIGAPVKLTFAANGYETKELTITPTENVLLPVSMDKATAAVQGTGRRPSNGKGGGTIHSDLEGFDDKK
jgi:serine/threonine-protein kinase